MNPIKNVMRHLVMICAGTCLGLSTGCAPRAPAAYEPRIALADFAPGLRAPADGFELLADVHTTGQFACSLAIAKFAVPPAATDPALAEPRSSHDGDAPQHAVDIVPAAAVRLVPLDPAEEAWWAEALRGVEAVRDLRFVRPLTTRPEGETIADLCEVAVRLDAPLLLVYARNTYGPNSAQVLGALFETAGRQPLATLRSAARMLDAGGVETAPDEKEGDHRGEDASWQAQRAFEADVLAVMRELIHRDEPPSTTQPHRWHTPPIERWWIKHR